MNQAIVPEDVQAVIQVYIYKDPARPLEANITGEVTHKHILSVQRPITHAFRDYMRDLRATLTKEN